MKIQFAVFDDIRSEMFTDTFAGGPEILVPIVGDVIQIRKSKWVRITGRKIAYDEDAINVYLTGVLHTDPVAEVFGGMQPGGS